MSKPVLLQDRFTGIWRDDSRDDLPPGKVWNLTDYFPNVLNAPLRKRGGWSYHGSALTSIDASAGVPARVAVAPFSTGTVVVAIDDRANPELIDLTNSADRGSVYGASAATPLGPLVFYREMLLIPSPALAAAPVGPRKLVTGGTISALGGSPPGARFFAIHKDRVAAASADTDTPNRIFFSGAGDAETWDTTNRYLDTSAPPVALASLRNLLLAFHAGSVERIRGDIPPGSAAANMTLEPLFGDVGIFEPNALAVADDYAYFADENGVYRTDGTTFTDMTKEGGISSFWRTQFASVGASGHVALGAWRGFLFCSLETSSDTFKDFLVCDLKSMSWFRFTNIRAYNFAVQSGSTDELYFSNRDTSSKRLGKLSSTFSPSSSVKNDADGDGVLPILETRLFDLGSQAKKRWRSLYATYDSRVGSGSGFFVGYLKNPQDTLYTTTAILDDTTNRVRARVPLQTKSYGVAIKIDQGYATDETQFYALEADVLIQESSRL